MHKTIVLFNVLFFSFSAFCGRLVWKESSARNTAIVGVFNPSTKTIEFKQAKYKNIAIAGVYNPSKGKVEFQEGLKRPLSNFRNI